MGAASFKMGILESLLSDTTYARTTSCSAQPGRLTGQPPSTGTQVGTNFLANSTMETYLQGSSNCFSCHTDDGAGSNDMLAGSRDSQRLSHIYFPLQPPP